MMWEAATSLSTVILAILTFALAKSARDSATFAKQAAEAARDQVTSSSESLRAAVRPSLVDDVEHRDSYPMSSERDVIRLRNLNQSIEVHPEQALVRSHVEGQFVYSVPVKNVGLGTALVRGVVMRYEPEEIEMSPMMVASSVSRVSIPPGGRARISFSVPGETWEFVRSHYADVSLLMYSIDITYSNTLGSELLRTKVEMGIGPNSTSIVTSIKTDIVDN